MQVPRVFGPRVVELLNLLELVDSEYSFRVPSVGSCLLPKARTQAGIVKWKLCSINNLVNVKGQQCMLCSRQKVQIFTFNFVNHILKISQRNRTGDDVLVQK